ncbi:neuraminidase-like domain-containing protein [Burkholderia ubonensis]|uniref:Tc toxin subunit A-related protein n=1 Tax=Burkholderia ubonensis TaxID=101571 RepID=UPI002AB43362|nr:neuraminidase-like domain-containing protein [Burkholderia ubonensis]MDY7791695.1 neuraminidase-like domain-containing protein [Burkholderia ubonensis]
MSTLVTDETQEPRRFLVTGHVRFVDDIPAVRTKVVAFDRDLRTEQPLGETQTDRNGLYSIEYSERQFLNQERGTADLVVKAFDADGSVLASSAVLFNAPAKAEIDLTIPLERKEPQPLFERIGEAVTPLLGKIGVQELEEDQEHQDLSFLAGECGFNKRDLARFALAHRLAHQGIETEFWFVLLGGSIFGYVETAPLKDQLETVTTALPSLDAGAVRKALVRGFNRREIAARYRERVGAWVEAFLALVGRLVLGDETSPTFARLALQHAGIDGADKQAKFARLFQQHRAVTPELLAALETDPAFRKAEIADLRTSYQLADLTRGDFSVVRMLKEEFNIRRPEDIRALAKQSTREWVDLVQRKHEAAEVTLPLGLKDPTGTMEVPEAELYAKMLDRQFREAFPTAAFAGGLERALAVGGAAGVKHARELGRIIDRDVEFDLLRTSLDEFLEKRGGELGALAKDPSFRVELKAVQRVFKLAPTFDATDALLSDGLHSAQMVYRLGETEFVRRYGKRQGFTPEAARATWNRAADTHAAVLTIVGDLASFDSRVLPGVLKSSHPDLAKFPNWNNLFQTGDICHCEHCRSALSPAAYFTDLLMYLRGRSSVKPKGGGGFYSVRDILFDRRPDLGYLELNCENALTTLPYVDVVCEVLERAVDAAGDNDVELTGLAAIPAGAAAAKAAVKAALDAKNVAYGGEFTLSQVAPSDPNRWIVHGTDATFLLKKKATVNFFAQLLPNTKATSAELRAYPAYVNGEAYKKLRAAKHPLAVPLDLFPEGDARRQEQRGRAFSLPFDLFAEEVRAGFQKSNLQRWDLMRTFRGPAAPSNPTDGEVAAEYCGISADPAAAFDEKRLIVVADATTAGQQAVWGETGNAGWLNPIADSDNSVANVKTFLRKTGLEYEELLALLDLPFINPAGDITIQHLDASCDTNKKVIQGLDEQKLDRVHRLLRLWRKLTGWKLWELALAIRCPGVGNGALDEPFLINLHYLTRLKTKLGTKTSIEQLCGLFDDLNAETRFTKAHERREDGLYQSLFLNKKLIQPLDSAFAVAAVDIAGPTAAKISDPQRRPVILAALGIREADLELFATLTRTSDGAPYITDDLTLANLSFLWRHTWLAKLLKFKAEDWKVVLKLLQQDIVRPVGPGTSAPSFADPKTVLEFVEKTDHLRNTGFTPDQLNWVLAADRSAKAAVKESDAARFLRTLRADLQAIRTEFDPAQYEFLEPASDVERLEVLLTGLLQQLHRTEAEARFSVETLRDEVVQEMTVVGLPASFSFPAAITDAPNHIRIEYQPVLRFAGPMTAAQRTVLLNDASLAAVTGLASYQQGIQKLFDTPGSAAAVPDLPAGFTFPATITGAPNNFPIRYEPVVRFTGLMTAAQRTMLLTDAALAAVTGIAAYQQAVGQFFQAPRLALKFVDPVFTAPLAALPAAVDLAGLSDTALAQRISYDAEQRLLRLVGVLSPADKAALDALSGDASYLNAVNSLFTQPTIGVFPLEQLWLQDADLALPLRDPNPSADNLARNLDKAVRKGLVYLAKTRAEGLVIQQAAAQFGLTEALTRRLLTEYPVGPATLLAHLTGPFADTVGLVDYATLKTTFDGWFWAMRVAELWSKWKITLAEWEQLRSLTANAQLVDFGALPLDSAAIMASVERVLRTSRLLRMRASLPEPDTTLFEVLVRLNSGAYATQADFAADVERLNDQWTATNVQALVGALDLAYPNQYLLAENWERVRRAFYFVESLGTDVATVKTFASAAMGEVHTKTLKSILRARFGGETWLTLSAEIQDVLRERKRDALAAYLLTQPRPADAPTGKWENTNDLYAYYLLDVEMCSCQLTSRLVQASGSVQLFVQRCFMGIEPDVRVEADGPTGDSAWRWWKWMRKYRVWEANWKVWMWPENWILPELKRDRSPFFKDLEKELLQNEINQYTVEAAFANYLEKLDGVAQLEIAGFYQEDDGDNTILHVFGRTTGAEPHLYYYRRYDYRQWMPWEKVDLDIQGDYLITAVVNKRLFLFWPVFTEMPDETENSNVDMPDAIGGSTIKKPNAAGDQRVEGPGAKSVEVKKAAKKLRLQMAVSDYRQGKWSPKRVSKDYDDSGSYRADSIRRHYAFFPVDRSEIDGRFGVKYSGWSVDGAGSMQAYLSGAFEIAGCAGVPVLVNDLPGYFRHAIRPETASTGSYTSFLKWQELSSRTDYPENDLSLESTLASSTQSRQLTPVLMQTPWLFRVSPPWHLSYLDRFWLDIPMLLLYRLTGERQFTPTGSWLPFFYGDKKRTFFVLPSLAFGRGNNREKLSGTNRIYYPEIKREFRKWDEYFVGQFRAWADALDLTALTAAQRQQVEQFLAAQVPGETVPPFTDAEVRDRLVRFFMRFVHYYLGAFSWLLFQFRQFHFLNFYHPFVCDFAKLVHNPVQGIPGLMRRETQLDPIRDSRFSFDRSYQPDAAAVVKLPSPSPSLPDCYPREIVDFSPDGAYSLYNWELFFHAPLLIANALSKNQRFEEARDWYHFIFNPIGVESAIPGGSAMSKFWITKPFFETTDSAYVQQRIENIMRMLAGDTSVPGYSVQAKNALEDQVRDWRTNPFEPHRIANYRTVAYQKTVVMNYLDNLIAWGDYLFHQDSMESINEAAQLYILAAEILGPRPKRVPPKDKPPVETFNELEHLIDAVPNALVEIENLVPALSGEGDGAPDAPPLPMLYFCIPHNEKMLGYWDTVADRLYKIRHCMNIEGVVRQLALFEPPIDPGALVKAVAAGVDIGAALADLNAPLPLYRFQVLLQKANEVCNDVKALGAALLGALEKRDVEALSLLRQGQEIRVLEAVKTVREQQIAEAKENLAGLKKNKETVTIRRNFYRDIEKIIAGEQLSLDEQGTAQRHQTAAQNINIAASVLGYLPNVTIGASGFGGSPHVNVQWGTGNIISALQAASGSEQLMSSLATYRATRASTLAGYDRRFNDWKLQESLASKELEQLERSIAAAEVRIAIAEKELENHLGQIDNAKAVDTFLRSKYTNEELYQWQIGQISSVFFQSYKLAYDLAKQAERCFRFELGLNDSRFITFGYWDSLKKGLLSGEKLQYDLRRLESAYLEQNRREFELTKHISLGLLDPLALVKLRETGRCFFRLPEELYDLDYPGHYFRRIKSVSLTLPCVAGPYTTVSCTLRLIKNSIRATTASGDNGYPRNTDDASLPAEDTRFVESNIPVRAIAASNAQNDSGVFELNFRDERYLPFEGAGAISEWSLELFTDLPANNPDPANPDFGSPLRQFDYSTIADSVLHVKYTAREDAGAFKNGAIAHLRDYFSEDGTTRSWLALDLRRDFGTAWSQFLNPANPANGNVFELEMSTALFPLRDATKTLKINTIVLLARCSDPGKYDVTLTPPLAVQPPVDSNTMVLAKSNMYGGLHYGQKDVAASGVDIVPTDEPVIWKIKVTRPGGGNLIEDPVKKVMEVEDLILVLGCEWQ